MDLGNGTEISIAPFYATFQISRFKSNESCSVCSASPRFTEISTPWSATASDYSVRIFCEAIQLTWRDPDHLFCVVTAYLIKTVIKSLRPGKVKKGKIISKHDMKTGGGRGVKVKFTSQQTMKAQGWNRGIAIPFFNLGPRWGGLSTPRPGRFNLGKRPGA
jgi:hypothetical protein